MSLKTICYFLFLVGLIFLFLVGLGTIEITLQRLALILSAVLGGGIMWIVSELPEDKK
jgi:hypothetical protein